MVVGEPHECRFVRRLVWGTWIESGSFLERDARRIEICEACGGHRPTRARRAPELLERASRSPVPPPDRDPAAVVVAESLRRRAVGADDARGSARGVLGAVQRRGITRSAAEAWLERFLASGWLRLRWRVQGTRRVLHSVEVCQTDAVTEYARPGEVAVRRETLAAARTAVASATHPIAREVLELLAGPDADQLDPRLVRALAAIALHVDRGDVLAVRSFSARYLDDSKLLARLRRRLEVLIGPLEVLGIRDGATLTLTGGTGRLELPDTTIDLSTLAPFVGLSGDAVQRLRRIEFPSRGLLVVENLTPFEACCREEVEVASGALVVWSAGYPSRAVHRIVDLARASGAPILVWADLDLDGIRIARLVASWAGGRSTTYRMNGDEVRKATVARPLSHRARRVLSDDLRVHPDAMLGDTVRALLDRQEWVEQETMLTSSPVPTTGCAPHHDVKTGEHE